MQREVKLTARTKEELHEMLHKFNLLEELKPPPDGVVPTPSEECGFCGMQVDDACWSAEEAAICKNYVAKKEQAEATAATQSN